MLKCSFPGVIHQHGASSECWWYPTILFCLGLISDATGVLSVSGSFGVWMGKNRFQLWFVGIGAIGSKYFHSICTPTDGASEQFGNPLALWFLFKEHVADVTKKALWIGSSHVPIEPFSGLGGPSHRNSDLPTVWITVRHSTWNYLSSAFNIWPECVKYSDISSFKHFRLHNTAAVWIALAFKKLRSIIQSAGVPIKFHMAQGQLPYQN